MIEKERIKITDVEIKTHIEIDTEILRGDSPLGAKGFRLKNFRIRPTVQQKIVKNLELTSETHLPLSFSPQ